MNANKCARCKKEFHIAYPNSDVLCPYCGYSSKVNEEVGRKNIREKVVKECVLSAAFGSIPAQTVDISDSGFGIKIDNKALPFQKNDILSIGLPDNAVKQTTQVIWIKSMGESSSRIGVRIC